MAEPTKRPSTRERRAHSAKARLTPDRAASSLEREKILREAKERTKSAKQIKDKHKTSAKMFAGSSSSKGRFTSMYSSDFEGTYVPPPEARPTSPTRRNNPHPGKQFMVWRIPTRDIGGTPYDEGLELPPEYLARNENFDAIDEITGNLGGLKLPPPRQTSMEYGAYLRKAPQPQYKDPRTRVKPVSNEVLSRTVAGGNHDALEDWLQTASPDERHTVLKMLKSAEEAQVKETINTVMQPTAAKAVQGWLQHADDKERDVAVRLFSSLGSRPPRRRTLSEPGTPEFRPPSRKPVPPAISMGQSKYDPGRQGEKLRTRRLSAPPGARPKPFPAGIWHHQAVRDPPPQVYHRGSLFGAVREGASHFNVHPEWPDYHGPRDVVH